MPPTQRLTEVPAMGGILGQTWVPFGLCVLWLSYLEASIPNEVMSCKKLSALVFTCLISYVKWPTDNGLAALKGVSPPAPEQEHGRMQSYSSVGTLVFTDTVVTPLHPTVFTFCNAENLLLTKSGVILSPHPYCRLSGALLSSSTVLKVRSLPPYVIPSYRSSVQ